MVQREQQRVVRRRAGGAQRDDVAVVLPLRGVLEEQHTPLVDVARGRARLEDRGVDVVADRQPVSARVDVIGRRRP